MRNGRFLTKVARWIARVLSGMANRIDRPNVAPAAGMAGPDQALAALTIRFPGAPEHWLRVLAERMPPPDAVANHQLSEQIPARPPTRAVSARHDAIPKSIASHPAPHSHRVRPVRLWRKQSSARRSSERLLLPGLWRRMQVQFNLLAHGQMPSPRPSAPLIGSADVAPAVRATSIIPPNSAEPSPPEQRHELMFGRSGDGAGARSVAGYPEPWFSEQSGLDGAGVAVAALFDQGLPINSVQLPAIFAMPAGEQNFPEVWPTMAPAEVRAASQFPAPGRAGQRPVFVAIGDEQFGAAQHRRTHQTGYAATLWPDLPPSDAFIADAEPSPAAHDALRFEQMVGRWSA